MFFFIFPANKWFFFIALAAWLTAWFFVFKKAKQKTGFTVALLLFLLSLWGLINLPVIQNFLVKKVTAVLSKKLQTKVEVKHVDFSLFNKMLIEGVLVEDQKKDTLLYAGTARVNITDWFFFKDKATLKYLALQNAVVNMKRTDSVWNYQYIIDYFSSPQKSASSKQGLQFDFKILELENIRFNKTDQWTGRDLSISLKRAAVSADSIDFNNQYFAINTITLDKPLFYQRDYTGADSIKNIPGKTIHTATATQAYKWNEGGMVINVKDLIINDGSFQNEKDTERQPYTDRFDGQHLFFSAINGDLKDIRLQRDTVWANALLGTKEKSGFEVKKLQALIKFTPDMMEFSNLDLVTPYSRLGNYYVMRYADFNDDMSDFLHSVTLEGRFENSRVSSTDIAFFAPDVKTWNRVIDIKGNAKGTIDNLVAKNMLLKSGNTFIDGDIALRGLPDIKNTFIDFKSNNLVTNYTDLTTLLPALKNVTQPNLNKLGNISFRGNYTGFINDFVTYGTINTSLGSIVADINMKLPGNKPATYSGKIFSSGFKLGQFINNASLGNIALDGNVTGSGFSLKDVNANFRGNIKQLEFSGYNYHNIVVDGKFEKKLFTGSGSVDDPNLKIEKFNGSVDFTGAAPAFNFDAELKKSNFKNLHLTLDDFALTGHFNLNFTGSNIDNFIGSARVYDAELQHNSTRLSFDSLTLKSFVSGSSKYLSFQTNEIEGDVTGKFTILELPDAFAVFLSKYYPAYISKPKYTVSDQDFSFSVKTKNVDEYVQLIDPKLKGFNNAVFSGNIKLAQNELAVNVTVPEFEYDKKIFNNVVLESTGNADTLTTKITTGDIVLNDSLHFPGTNLSIRSHNDVSVVQLKTSASKTLSEAELNATVQTLTDGVRIHFSPSSFIINDKKWQLEKDGELAIRKSYIDASEVKFVQENQEITFSTEMDDVTDKTNVIAKLKKVNINDFTPFFLKNPRLEGILTGTITLKDPFGKQTVEYDATAEDFRLDDKLIGHITMKGDVNTQSGLVKAAVKANNPNYKFDINGTYNYKDTTDNQMNFDLLSEHFDISLLDNYLGTIFSEMKGDAVSSLKVTGGAQHQSYTGNVMVSNGSLKVNYTQCRYDFTANTPIVFNPGEIDFGIIPIRDTLNNLGSVRGKLHYNNFFQDMSFDNVKFETGKMLLLNTTQKDNSQFYGKAIGRATMSLNGPITDMRMKIDGSTSALDSSHISLPTSDSRETGVIDYIEFIQFGSKMEDIKSKQGSNIFIDMDIEATPSCKIDVILDETTGDIIKGQGNGKLNIKVGTKEPITMRGQYVITQGEYKFNFQTFIQKYFNIKSGSTITWNKDPYEANIKIDAEYVAPKVNLDALSSSRGSQVKQKSDVSIIAHLTRTLKDPKISFEFVLPPESEASKDPIVQANLKKFSRDERDQNEMNRQVASLLLFNTFITENGGGIGSSTASFLSGTVGQVISGYLNNQLAKFFQRVFNDPTITPYLSLNSTYDVTNPELIKALQASGNFGFKKEYLEGRLVVSLGGNIDYNNPYILQARNTNVLLTPDITVEYLLSKDGKLRIVGFKKTSVDATLGQRNRTGIRLTLQKEFDKKRNRPDADKPKAKTTVKGSPGS